MCVVFALKLGAFFMSNQWSCHKFFRFSGYNRAESSKSRRYICAIRFWMCHEVTKELSHPLIYRLPPHREKLQLKIYYIVSDFAHNGAETAWRRNAISLSLSRRPQEDSNQLHSFPITQPFFRRKEIDRRMGESVSEWMFSPLLASLGGTEYIMISNCIQVLKNTKPAQTPKW